MASHCRDEDFIRMTRPILESGDLEALLRILHRDWPAPSLREILSSGSDDACKIALFSLSLVGTIDDCATIVSMLRHEDAYIVRLAEHALWSIWLRGKTPAAQARLQTAILMIAQDRLDEALNRLCLLIGEFPDFAEAYNQRAIAEFLSGQYDLARRDLHEALRLNPTHFAAIAGLGHCDAAEGLCQEALAYYQQALAIHPQVEGLQQAIEELRHHMALHDHTACFEQDHDGYPTRLDKRATHRDAER